MDKYQELDKAVELAGCMKPTYSQNEDGKWDSIGAEWLREVIHEAQDTTDGLYRTQEDIDDEADRQVPMFTNHLWQVWVDLGGYQFEGTYRDFSSHTDYSDTMNRTAQADVYEWARAIIGGWWGFPEGSHYTGMEETTDPHKYDYLKREGDSQ